MRPATEELIDRIHTERVSRLGRQSGIPDMSYKDQGQGQVRPRKVTTNYLFNRVWAADDLWVILLKWVILKNMNSL